MDLLLDAYSPVTPAAAAAAGGPLRRPAYILAHGGGNTGGSKEQECFQGSASFWAARGFVAFNIDYRLAGDHGLHPAGGPPSPRPTPPRPARAGDRLVLQKGKSGAQVW